MKSFLILVCGFAVLVSGANGLMKDVEYGMNMSVRACDIICWYDNVEVHPEKSPGGYYGCTGTAVLQRDYVKRLRLDENDTKTYFGQLMADIYMKKKLSSDWSVACKKYLAEPHLDPPANEAIVLQDNSTAPYPFKGFAHCIINTLRNVYGEKAIDRVQTTWGKRGTIAVEFGMEMSARAFDIVCWYENVNQYPEKSPKGYEGCKGRAEMAVNRVKGKLRDPELEEVWFGRSMLEEGRLANLGADYNLTCGSNLRVPDREPASDESQALEDVEGRPTTTPYPFQAFAYCLIRVLRDKYGDRAIQRVKREKMHGQLNKSSVIFGMSMAVRAYEVVCWHEQFKVYPPTSHQTLPCLDLARFRKHNAETYHGNDTHKMMNSFISYMIGYDNFRGAMRSLSDGFGATCNKFLLNYDDIPLVDKSRMLNDNATGPYPFQAFSYCILNLFRKTYGKKASEDAKREKTQGEKDWRLTFVDRDNEHRARHASPPFQLHDYLNNAAQKYAEYLADNCIYEYSPEQNLKWNGSLTGENIYATKSLHLEKSRFAYLASYAWYDEVRVYPYGAEESKLSDSNTDGFCQTVWKTTKFVGYGLAYNLNCGNLTSFMVARYFPAGNIHGKYKSNVLPPIVGNH